MLKQYILIIIVVLILYFMYEIFVKYNEVLYIKSDIDNKYYAIRRGNTKNNVYLKESANTLAEINGRISKLIKHLNENFKNHYDKSYFIEKLTNNYSFDILSEAAIDSRYTTYTIDKQDIHVCLRTRDNQEDVYDLNLLMYIILHELAHLCNYSENGIPIQGHGEEFKNIFKFLIIESIKIGIYDYENYYENPKEYCGIVISTTILPRNEMVYYTKSKN